MRVVAAAFLLTVLAFSGCLAFEDDDPTTSTTPTSTSGTRTSATTTSGTGNQTSSTTRAVNFTADVLNGTAPLLVNFTFNATGNTSGWHLAYGDGHDANGTTLPAAVNYTYEIGGAFSANLTVTYPDGQNASATLNLTILVPAGAPPPDVLFFEFADSLGCVGDAGADTCVSFTAGPDAPVSGIDGYWQALDERYWGLSFTTTVDQVQPALADSDCAFTDAAHAIIGEANNGGSPCAGAVPAGTAFIFLYPYALPALSQTLTFTV